LTMSATSSGRCASAATMIDHSFRPTFAAPAGVQADAFATRGLLGASAVADALGDQRDRATRIRRPSGAWRCGTGRPGVAQYLALVDREHLPAARQIAARMASWTVRLRTSRSRCATITPFRVSGHRTECASQARAVHRVGRAGHALVSYGRLARRRRRARRPRR
jgi:hypothetical protein